MDVSHLIRGKSKIKRIFYSYSKNEFIKPGDAELHEFRFILTEAKGKFAEETIRLEETHEIIEIVDCFGSIGLQYQSFLPVKIKTKPCIVIMRKINSDEEEVVTTMAATKKAFRNRKLNGERKRNVIKEQQTDEKAIDIEPDSTNAFSSGENSAEIQFDDDEKDTTDALIENKPKELKRTRLKIKALIESHYRAKGRIIESVDGADDVVGVTKVPAIGAKTNIKQIIKAEKIKELVEKISHLDLKIVCQLDTMSTKECLLKLIDDYDGDDDNVAEIGSNATH